MGSIDRARARFVGCWFVVAAGVGLLGSCATATDVQEGLGVGGDDADVAADAAPARPAGDDAAPTDATPPDADLPGACEAECPPPQRCRPDPNGQLVCTGVCDPDDPRCPPGFDCRLITNSGADATWECAPRPDGLCEACIEDADCAALGLPADRCLPLADGRFCGSACADGFCRRGYQCTDGQCVPASGGCLDCRDADGDGFGLGAGCAGADCDDHDISRHAGAAEVCDGIDNDCDAAIDEAPLPPPPPLNCRGAGVCMEASVDCVGGEWICDRPPAYEEAESLCDGLDNDCNGRVDDIPGRGEACEAGLGACRRPGVLVCEDGGTLACSAVPAGPVVERCNGIDDDCNGLVDDVDGAGAACDAGEGDCRVRGERLCRDGRLACSAEPAPPRPEACDGRDNDCDGRVDEDVPPPCDAEEERCNGLDDDQDGATDEGIAQACANACGGGRQVCEQGEWGPCDAPEPEPERCNAADDDCDGRADEALVQPCDTPCGAGERRCEGGAWAACAGPLPRPEACNDADDDCDGRIDEGACGVCQGRPDGALVDVDDWGACQGFEEPCGQVGERERQRRICRGGEVVVEVEREGCQRDTDGLIQAEGPWGACGGFADACDETGTEERAVTLCQAGRQVLQDEQRPCQRDTDGLVLGASAWGICGGFSDDCDETGQQTRSREICRAGRRTFEDEQRPCGRDTDGQVVDVGAWGPCGGFRDACDESGTQQRTTELCVGGRVDFRDEQRACQRATDGARCEGDGTCQNERCLHPDVCNGLDDDGDGFIDNPEPPERGCMFWITHHTNCLFRSWHGAWQAATSAEERNAASCPPDPNNPLAGCGGCAVAQRVCGVPPYAASYNTCWQEADGNRLRTYVRPQAAQGFNLLLRHCFNAGTGQNSYVTGNTCASLGAGWGDGTPATMGYMAAVQPNGRWEEPVWRYYVCSHRNADGFVNHWITRDCAAGSRVRTLGWSFGP